MTTIINGKKIAENIKNNIVKEIVKLKRGHPNLAIILVGEREDSTLYVNLKEKEAKKTGIDTRNYKCPANTKEEEIIEMIKHLNNDSLIDAILVQLPLPSGFDTDKIIKTINPAKDVERFHPKNIKTLLSTCNHTHVMPPLFQVILEIFKNINLNIKNKQICIIYNSDIFGKSLAKVLECRKARVKLAHAQDNNLKEVMTQADIIITAVGKPKFIKKDMIKKDAIIIDIGITKKGKMVKGDVDFDDVKDKASFITPVPGGVGPLTIAMLFKNTLELYKQNKRNKKN